MEESFAGGYVLGQSTFGLKITSSTFVALQLVKVTKLPRHDEVTIEIYFIE
jgi:hypothetical protein